MLDAVRARAAWHERLRNRAPRAINADVRALPLANGSLGLAWSNLMLHWLDDPPALNAAFAELHRVLEVGGLLMFSMLGPDTLKELRTAAQKVGAGDTARRFLDMHDIGDMLVQAGFADPVMDMEMVTLTYASPRGLSARPAASGCARRPVSAGWAGATGARYSPAGNGVDGRLPASFEIVYGHAWKAASRTAPDGRPIVRFAARR